MKDVRYGLSRIYTYAGTIGLGLLVSYTVMFLLATPTGVHADYLGLILMTAISLMSIALVAVIAVIAMSWEEIR